MNYYLYEESVKISRTLHVCVHLELIYLFKLFNRLYFKLYPLQGTQFDPELRLLSEFMFFIFMWVTFHLKKDM